MLHGRPSQRHAGWAASGPPSPRIDGGMIAAGWLCVKTEARNDYPSRYDDADPGHACGYVILLPLFRLYLWILVTNNLPL